MRTLARCLCLAIALLPLATQAAVRWQDAETWVSYDLAPAVVKHLTEHPRFRGQTIRVVAFENGAPAARSSGFALALRDRLSSALLQVPNIRMAAPQQAGTRLDCTLADVDYFVGLQVTESGSSSVQLVLRTLDVRNNTWVTGFDMSWQGALNAGQRRALRKVDQDPWFQGRRTAPFDAGEADVLARKLARELACASTRQLGGEYVVYIEPGTVASLPGVTELIANNLTSLVSMQFTDDPARANAVLRGKAHAVDRNLGQFWATLAPNGGGAEIPALTANAYVRVRVVEPVAEATPTVSRPDKPATAGRRQAMSNPVSDSTLGVLPTSPANPAVALPPTRGAAFMRAVRVVGGGRGLCRGMGRSCAALEMRSRETAALFFLNHQPRHGLVRLAGDACRKPLAPRVLQADTIVRVPLPLSTRDAAPVATVEAIGSRPRAETYYALTVSDSRAALAFSRHLKSLPQRCTVAARFGLRDAALDAWLDRFEQMMETWRDDVDLRAIRARGVS